MSYSGTVFAAGFALIEVNATGQGNAYAGAAVATDNASTIFFNPAGMMNLGGDQLVVAGHFIEPSASFTNDGSSMAPVYATAAPPPSQGLALTGGDDDGGSGAFVPNLYWVKTINPEMKFGLGVNTPFGLATEYDKDWVGRYHGVFSDLKTVNFNPSLAYRLSDKVSIGGGLNLMMGLVELTSAVDMGSVCVAGLSQTLPFNAALAACEADSAGPQTNDGFADLSGDNFDEISTGYNLGLVFKISEKTAVGLAYRSEVEMEVTGEADFTVPTDSPTLDLVLAGSVVNGDGLFADSDLESAVDLPASFSISLSHRVGNFTLLADATRTGWSSFEELRIVYDNPDQPDSVTTYAWEDSWRYSIGLDYRYSDKLILRTGLALDESPVPSAERRTPRLPGSDRTWLSFGFSYLLDKKLSIDFGYSHLFVDDAEINNEFESSVSTLNATLSGEYEADVDILSAQLNWQLD